ncbi:MAG: helix-turn-helix transcriptional regulator, partial [Sandaracinaceae bacterium]|nr:helix-turn-helix transcriptional regulator [Sandaracinaceae bacterium]
MTDSVDPASPDTSPGDFAAEIRARTKAAGLSLAQLAERAELDASLVSRLTNGQRAPRPEHVVAIARALGVGPLELGTEAAKAMTIEWVARAELEREIA